MQMGDLIKFALLFAERVDDRKGRQTIAQVALLAAATLAGASFGFAAIACALVALWLGILPQVGPVGAPLVVAGVLLFMCVVLFAVVRYELKPRPQPAAPSVPAVLIADATRLINENKGSVLLAALLAGLAVGGRNK